VWIYQRKEKRGNGLCLDIFIGKRIKGTVLVRIYRRKEEDETDLIRNQEGTKK